MNEYDTPLIVIHAEPVESHKKCVWDWNVYFLAIGGAFLVLLGFVIYILVRVF